MYIVLYFPYQVPKHFWLNQLLVSLVPRIFLQLKQKQQHLRLFQSKITLKK